MEHTREHTMEHTREGWLVNDCLTCIPGTTTFWHDLLTWFHPWLRDKTRGYTDYSVLADRIEQDLRLGQTSTLPTLLIRNGSYFRVIRTPPTVRTIALIQDVPSDSASPMAQMQREVMEHADVVVFNTEYVAKKYASVRCKEIRICPLGVDFDFFCPLPQAPDPAPAHIVFIGAATQYPKGFEVMREIIAGMPDQRFCLIMKDGFTVEQLPVDQRARVQVYNRVDQETVRALLRQSSVAVCTSYEETQHLSGIECAACNVPIVARAVGVYADRRDDPRWGRIAETNADFIPCIRDVLSSKGEWAPRDAFLPLYSKPVCRENWERLVVS